MVDHSGCGSCVVTYGVDGVKIISQLYRIIPSLIRRRINDIAVAYGSFDKAKKKTIMMLIIKDAIVTNFRFLNIILMMPVAIRVAGIIQYKSKSVGATPT